jgi:hypothetical protein
VQERRRAQHLQPGVHLQPEVLLQRVLHPPQAVPFPPQVRLLPLLVRYLPQVAQCPLPESLRVRLLQMRQIINASSRSKALFASSVGHQTMMPPGDVRYKKKSLVEEAEVFLRYARLLETRANGGWRSSFRCRRAFRGRRRWSTLSWRHCWGCCWYCRWRRGSRSRGWGWGWGWRRFWRWGRFRWWFRHRCLSLFTLLNGKHAFQQNAFTVRVARCVCTMCRLKCRR